MFVVEIKNLSVDFGEVNVLKNVSLQISAGEIVAIIGPNGSGKTTLIRVMLGMLPYKGNIKILGTNPKKAINLVSYVPQHFSFDRSFPLTVQELLCFVAEIKKIRPKQVKQTMEDLEITNYQTRLLGELSGGQLQRVLIARAVLTRPKILFLDEATVGIDLEGEKDFYQIIKYLNKRYKTTIIMVSHEINMVYRFATQIICLNRDLVCMGMPKETITREVLKKLYGKEVDFREHKH